MKHCLAMLLALTMALSLAACGSRAATDPTPPAESPVVDTDIPDPNTSDESIPPSSSVPGAQDQEGQQGGDTSTPAPSPTDPAAPPSDTTPNTPADAQTPATQTPSAIPAGAADTSASPSPAPPVVTVPASDPPAPADDGPNILIAYFTWADNTHVADPSAVDVDATTSASILAPGNAAKMAVWIQQVVGGDLHSIVVKEPYSSDYDECMDQAADEKAAGARPALSSHVGNMEDYDVVFIGIPNWWNTTPMAVLTFAEEYDFSGKTIVPFVTHGTGGIGAVVRDLTASLPDDVIILDEIGIYRPEVDSSQSAVQDWAQELELDS